MSLTITVLSIFCLLPVVILLIFLMATQSDLTSERDRLAFSLSNSEQWRKSSLSLAKKLEEANERINKLQLSQKQIQDLICKTAKETSDSPPKPISHLFGVSVDPSIAAMMKDQAIIRNKDGNAPVDLRGFKIELTGLKEANPSTSVAEQASSQRIT